jgi:hypothetical protein
MNTQTNQVIQADSGAHPASDPVGKWGYFSGIKAAGLWSWLPTSN